MNPKNKPVVESGNTTSEGNGNGKTRKGARPVEHLPIADAIASLTAKMKENKVLNYVTALTPAGSFMIKFLVIDKGAIVNVTREIASVTAFRQMGKGIVLPTDDMAMIALLVGLVEKKANLSGIKLNKIEF